MLARRTSSGFDKHVAPDFYEAEPTDVPLKNLETPKDAAWKYLERNVPDHMEDLKGSMKLYVPGSVNQRWGFGTESPKGRVPTIMSVSLNQQIRKLDLTKATDTDIVVSLVDGLACTQGQIKRQDKFDGPPYLKWLKAMTPYRSFEGVFKIRCSDIVVQSWVWNSSSALNLTTMTPQLSEVTGYDFRDIRKTPVLSAEHEAAVLSARTAIKEYEAHTGNPVVIKHIPTKGFFIADDFGEESAFSLREGSNRSRCFATLIEKGIGAYKNEIRVYLNPALRAL